MDELRKRLEQLKPVVKIDDLFEDGPLDIAAIVASSQPISMAR